MWTETYPIMKGGEAVTEAFLAMVEDFYNRGVIVDVGHKLIPGSEYAPGLSIAPNGAGGGSPTVAGGQKGRTIDTTGWTASVTDIVSAGDCVKLPGSDILYKIVENASSNSSGQVTLKLNPVVYKAITATGSVSTENNKFKAIIKQYNVPTAPPNEYYGGVSITFQEVPNA